MADNGFIDIEVNVRQAVDVRIDVRDIIHSINELNWKQKASAIAGIILAIDLEANGEDIKPDERELIVNWLQKQLKLWQS